MDRTVGACNSYDLRQLNRSCSLLKRNNRLAVPWTLRNTLNETEGEITESAVANTRIDRSTADGASNVEASFAPSAILKSNSRRFPRDI